MSEILLKADRELLKEVYDHLIRLGNYEIDPCYPNIGVCFELVQKFNLSYDFICNRDCSSFEHYSGNAAYPIGFQRYDSWDKSIECGRNRRLFCLWLAEDIKKNNFEWVSPELGE